MNEILIAERPEGWDLFRLGQVFEERKQKASDKDFEALSVTMHGIVPQLDTAAKTDDGDNRKLVREGDYVINSRSDRKGSGGISPFDGTVSLISIVLQPRKGIEPAFAHHLLRSLAFQEEFYRMGHGIVADLWTTRFAEMKNIRFHLPDLPTQKRIAAFLDRETARIDELIAKKERLVEVLKLRFDAMVRDSVTKGAGLSGISLRKTDIDYLGHLPAHWSVEKVGWRYSIQLGKMLDAAKQTGLHKKPYLRVADVQWDAINSTDLPKMDFTPEDQKKFRIEKGDLLVNEGGSYVGRSAIWRGASGEVFYQKALHRLRPLDSKRDSSEFMLWLMWFATKEGIFVANGNQTTIDHLTAEAFKAYRFGFPPLEEQQKIAILLRKERDISAELEGRINASIDRLREYRGALITAAVTGQIDVETYGKAGTTSETLDRIEEEMQS